MFNIKEILETLKMYRNIEQISSQIDTSYLEAAVRRVELLLSWRSPEFYFLYGRKVLLWILVKNIFLRYEHLFNITQYEEIKHKSKIGKQIRDTDKPNIANEREKRLIFHGSPSLIGCSKHFSGGLQHNGVRKFRWETILLFHFLFPSRMVSSEKY